MGALYVRGGIPVNVIEGGAQERGKRAGTENVPGIAGMAAALEDACAHMEENRVKVTALRDRLIQGLSKIPHSAVNGDLEHRLPGNVNLCFEGIEGESLLLLLDAAGICASSGSFLRLPGPCSMLLAIGRPHEVAHGSPAAEPVRVEHPGREWTTSCGGPRVVTCGPCPRCGKDLNPVRKHSCCDSERSVLNVALYGDIVMDRFAPRNVVRSRTRRRGPGG